MRISLQTELHGINCLAADADSDGIIPSEIQRLLSRWKPGDAKNPASDIPKVIYLVPNGGNPSGATISTARRHQIYQVS